MIGLVRSFLAEDGPIARALGGDFEPRPEQLKMAEAVAGAMERRTSLLAEAGTGVGKSLAYLVPAAIRALVSGETIVIATNTIALQEQLLTKDIPILQRALELARDTLATERTLKPVLVKGRSNYISIRRLVVASQRADRILEDAGAREQLAQIQRWAYQTTDGTRATLPQLHRPEVWGHVESDSDNCQGRRCPHYKECFYQRARREMEGANLIVCNHALFFSDMALKAQNAGILPRSDHTILDEAHHVEEVACEHLGVSLAEGRIAHLLRTLYNPRRGKGFVTQIALSLNDNRRIDELVRLVTRAENASHAFFDALLRLIDTGRARGGRLRQPRMAENLLSPVFEELASALRLVREELPGEDDKMELAALAKRAADIALAAEVLIEQRQSEAVYWIDAEGARAGRVRITLSCAPVRVAPILRERLFGAGQGVILTSATLAIERSSREDPFRHAKAWLGCEEAATIRLGSPFDYARQVTLHIDRAMPEPGARADQAYLSALGERILRHAKATRGGAFILFTSLATMNQVADAIGHELEAAGLPILVQGRELGRSALLERFRADERSILFGAATFWQGVDVRGRALRNVIITRLPFDPPDRPLAEARGELLQSEGGDPFRDDALPRAVIRFKQGFGRLIRSGNDTGRVVVLDPRFATKGYAAAFRAAVPEGVRVFDESSDSEIHTEG